MSPSHHSRPRRLDNAPLDYAPENEMGVVFLFSALAKKFGLRVAEVKAGFPDCIAYDRSDKRIRIEFEYRSRNFKAHRHDPKGCDWIVCWIHDWPGCPKRLEVKELRRLYGQGKNIWIVPVEAFRGPQLDRERTSERWSVPSQAGKEDLILFYRTTPDRFVRNIFKIDDEVKVVRARWKEGMDWMAPIRKVCDLKSPLHLSDMKAHRTLKTAGFVRGNMRGRYSATAHWTELHGQIVARNPSVARALKTWSPESL